MNVNYIKDIIFLVLSFLGSMILSFFTSQELFCGIFGITILVLLLFLMVYYKRIISYPIRLERLEETIKIEDKNGKTVRYKVEKIIDVLVDNWFQYLHAGFGRDGEGDGAQNIKVDKGVLMPKYQMPSYDAYDTRLDITPLCQQKGYKHSICADYINFFIDPENSHERLIVYPTKKYIKNILFPADRTKAELIFSRTKAQMTENINMLVDGEKQEDGYIKYSWQVNNVKPGEKFILKWKW